VNDNDNVEARYHGTTSNPTTHKFMMRPWGTTTTSVLPLGGGVTVRLVMMMMMMMISLLSLLPTCVEGQLGRFLRKGEEPEDFAAELRLEDEGSMSVHDMSREMYLMKDLRIQLPMLHSTDLAAAIPDRQLRHHVQQYLGRQPVELKLLKKRGRFGYKAIGTLRDNSSSSIDSQPPGKGQTKKKRVYLRAFWRVQTTPPPTTGRPDFTRFSYDDAVRLRLPVAEFQVQLPPLKGSPPRNGGPNRGSGGDNKNSGGGSELPTVIYQVPFDNGSMDPKCLVPRTTGRVTVRYQGYEYVVDHDQCRIGTCAARLGVVDPSWARGRAVFRSYCRKSGL
jgi:hypothetical protein